MKVFVNALVDWTDQRTHTVGGSITVQLVSSFTSLESAATQRTKNIFSLLVKSNLVKLETSCTVIIPPTVSVLWTVENKESVCMEM